MLSIVLLSHIQWWTNEWRYCKSGLIAIAFRWMDAYLTELSAKKRAFFILLLSNSDCSVKSTKKLQMEYWQYTINGQAKKSPKKLVWPKEVTNDSDRAKVINFVIKMWFIYIWWPPVIYLIVLFFSTDKTNRISIWKLLFLQDNHFICYGKVITEIVEICYG